MAKARQKRRNKNKKRSRAGSGLSSQQLLALEGESLKGFKALENEEYESAEDHFKRALKIGLTTNAAYGLGTVYMKQERYDEAHRVFADLVKMAPNNALYWYSFGAVSMHKEDASTALDALKKARRLCPPDDYELRDGIKTLLKSIDQFSDIEFQEDPDIDRKSYLEQAQKSGTEPAHEIVIVDPNQDDPFEKPIEEQLTDQAKTSKINNNKHHESGFQNYYYLIAIVAVFLLLALLGYWFMG